LLGGGKKIVLVGHSMGGRVAIAYAAAYPEDLEAVVIEDIDLTAKYAPTKPFPDVPFDRSSASWEEARAKLVAEGYGEARVDGFVSLIASQSKDSATVVTAPTALHSTVMGLTNSGTPLHIISS
jgi:pimeloyl-ACP methyl ester carboxylesterase